MNPGRPINTKGDTESRRPGGVSGMKRNIIETALGGIVLLVAVGFIVFAFKSASA